MPSVTISIYDWACTFLIREPPVDQPLSDSEAREFLQDHNDHFHSLLDANYVPHPSPGQARKLEALLPLTVGFKNAVNDMHVMKMKPSMLAPILARHVGTLSLGDPMFYLTSIRCSEDSWTALRRNAQVFLNTKPGTWHGFSAAALGLNSTGIHRMVYFGKAMIGSILRTLVDIQDAWRLGKGWNILYSGAKYHAGHVRSAQQIGLFSYEDRLANLHTTRKIKSLDDVDLLGMTRLPFCAADPSISMYIEAYIASLCYDPSLNLDYPGPRLISINGWPKEYAEKNHNKLVTPSSEEPRIAVLGPVTQDGDPLPLAYCHIGAFYTQMVDSEYPIQYINTRVDRYRQIKSLQLDTDKMDTEDKDQSEDEVDGDEDEDEDQDGYVAPLNSADFNKLIQNKVDRQSIDIDKAMESVATSVTTLIMHGKPAREAFSLWATEKGVQLHHVHPKVVSQIPNPSIINYQWYELVLDQIPRLIVFVRNYRTNVPAMAPCLVDIVRMILVESMVAATVGPARFKEQFRNDIDLLTRREALDYATMGIVQSRRFSAHVQQVAYTDPSQFPDIVHSYLQEVGVMSNQTGWEQQPLKVAAGRTEVVFQYFATGTGNEYRIPTIYRMGVTGNELPPATTFTPHLDLDRGIVQGFGTDESIPLFSKNGIWFINKSKLSTSSWTQVLRLHKILPEPPKITHRTAFPSENLNPHLLLSLSSESFAWDAVEQGLIISPSTYKIFIHWDSCTLHNSITKRHKGVKYLALIYDATRGAILYLHFNHRFDYKGWTKLKCLSRGKLEELLLYLSTKNWGHPSDGSAIKLSDEWELGGGNDADDELDPESEGDNTGHGGILQHSMHFQTELLDRAPSFDQLSAYFDRGVTDLSEEVSRFYIDRIEGQPYI